MNKLYTLIFIFFSFIFVSEIKAQKKDYSGVYSGATSSNTHFTLDLKNKKFSLVKKDGGDDAIHIEIISQGNISFNQDEIICKGERNGSATYRLKHINDEMLVNYDIDYLSDTLYVVSKESGNFRIFGGWKDGKKERYWHYINTKDVKEGYYILYGGGIPFFSGVIIYSERQEL